MLSFHCSFVFFGKILFNWDSLISSTLTSFKNLLNVSPIRAKKTYSYSYSLYGVIFKIFFGSSLISNQILVVYLCVVKINNRSWETVKITTLGPLSMKHISIKSCPTWSWTNRIVPLYNQIISVFIIEFALTADIDIINTWTSTWTVDFYPNKNCNIHFSRGLNNPPTVHFCFNGRIINESKTHVIFVLSFKVTLDGHVI